MTRFQIMSLLNSQSVKSDKGVWDIWFQGNYLGGIESLGNEPVFFTFDSHEQVVGKFLNYHQAVASFINDAEVILAEQARQALIHKDPELKQIGIREPKSLWKRIKEWF